MAQFVHQYVQALLDGQATAGKMLGVDVYGISREQYVMNLTTLALIGVVMQKISQVAPAVTDAVWLEALNHALDATNETPWPVNMLAQIDPSRPPGPP